MRKHRTVIIQIVLFIATFITTTFASSYWASGNFNFVEGLPFSIPFLLFLTAHEFGHYFMAMYHKVRVSLPYFIPFPILTGTLGAVIIKERAASKANEFDIGIAGPIAGFVIGFLTLCYGFSTLPPAEHIFKIHPEYQKRPAVCFSGLLWLVFYDCHKVKLSLCLFSHRFRY